jgi:hypothetical protein
LTKTKWPSLVALHKGGILFYQFTYIRRNLVLPAARESGSEWALVQHHPHRKVKLSAWAPPDRLEGPARRGPLKPRWAWHQSLCRPLRQDHRTGNDACPLRRTHVDFCVCLVDTLSPRPGRCPGPRFALITWCLEPRAGHVLLSRCLLFVVCLDIVGYCTFSLQDV